jgi:hypothetical protein
MEFTSLVNYSGSVSRYPGRYGLGQRLAPSLRRQQRGGLGLIGSGSMSDILREHIRMPGGNPAVWGQYSLIYRYSETYRRRNGRRVQ